MIASATEVLGRGTARYTVPGGESSVDAATCVISLVSGDTAQRYRITIDSGVVARFSVEHEDLDEAEGIAYAAIQAAYADDDVAATAEARAMRIALEAAEWAL